MDSVTGRAASGLFAGCAAAGRGAFNRAEAPGGAPVPAGAGDRLCIETPGGGRGG